MVRCGGEMWLEVVQKRDSFDNKCMQTHHAYNY